MFEQSGHRDAWAVHGPVVLSRRGRHVHVDGPARLVPWQPNGERPLSRLEGSFALVVNRRIRTALRAAARRAAAAHQRVEAQTPVDTEDVPVLSPDRVRLDALAQLAPSPEVLAQLLAEDPELLPADAGVAWLVAHQRCMAWLAAVGDAGLVAVAGATERIHEHRVGGGPLDQDHERVVKVRDAVCAEIGAALHQSRATISRRVDAARDLAGAMRPLRDALHAGTVSTGHAFAVREELLRLPVNDPDPAVHVDRCARVLADVLPYAEHRTPAQARKRTRALVAQIEPINSEDRRKHAARSHGVWVTDEGDDTSLLCSRMPTAHAHHALGVIRTLARDERLPGAGELSVGQRETVALMTLLHHGTCGAADAAELAAVAQARVTAQVQVVVSDAALAGLSEQPGYVDNEVVSAAAIRALVKVCGEDSTMRRLLTDPVSGRLLDYGRTTYAIPDALREFLAARDKTCRHPGCGIPAMHCQIDHAKPWDQGGETSRSNTGPLCTTHHNGKTHENWQIIQSRADGSCTWRSPDGRIYEHQPPPVLPPPLPPPTTNRCPSDHRFRPV